VTSDVAGLVAGLISVTLWGSAFVAIRSAGHDLSPGPMALERLLVSLVILTALARARRVSWPSRRDLAGVAGFGVLWLGVYSVALNAGERHVDAGTASLVINSGSILVAAAAGMLLHERLSRRLVTGYGTAFLGCGLIAATTTAHHTDGAADIALLILAAFAYAAAVTIQKPLLIRVSPLVVTWLGCAAATIVCLPFAPSLVEQARANDGRAVLWTAYLGVGPTTVGFLTWSFALSRTTVGRLGALTYLSPLVAVLLGWAALDEVPPPLSLVGGAMCLVGVVVARRRSSGQQPSPSHSGTPETLSTSAQPLTVPPPRNARAEAT